MTELAVEYGKLALVTYVVLCVLWFGGSWLAIEFGWKPQSAAGTAGTLAAAYVAYKLMMPLRIGVAVVLTPNVAKIVSPRGGRGASES